jgi:xanthine dehydrogenase accessory factor
MTWLDKAIAIVARGDRCVLVTVVEVLGSAPREVGARMLVAGGEIEGTIGGGNLEYRAIGQARGLLASDLDAPVFLQRHSLGPGLGQCCGGQVRLLFERLSFESQSTLLRWREAAELGRPCAVVSVVSGNSITRTFVLAESSESTALPLPVRQQVTGALGPRLIELPDGRYFVEPISEAADSLFLFGAGHVGKAIVRALAPLPFTITWIDSRGDAFPPDLPPQVAMRVSASPPCEVAKAPPRALFLVMTQSHPLDFDICAEVLARDDFHFLGLIGSETKRARFSSRLRAIGIPPHALTRLTCPIGIPGIASKQPAAIATGVAAQLLIVAERRLRTARAPSMVPLDVGT